MRSLMDPIYRAIESGDLGSFASHLSPDVFMFTPEAEGVLLSREAVMSTFADKLQMIATLPDGIRLEAEPVTAGEDPLARAAWVFDVVSIHVGESTTVLPTRVRVTALLTREADDWRVAACYWSLPFVTQADQDEVKHAGLLDPGMMVPEPGDVSAPPPYVAALIRALDEPRLLPDLYSTRQDHATIGSVVDEVFIGPAGRAAWEEFVGFVASFTMRGPVRALQVTDNLGWLATNIDIGQPPTPYRFFYIWIREDEQWRILISHDSVSRRLDAAAFL